MSDDNLDALKSLSAAVGDMATGGNRASDIIDWAVGEIEILRAMVSAMESQSPAGSAAGEPALTDAEREAVEWAAFEFDGLRPDNGKAAERAATLRGLLERTAVTKPLPK
jgi:hypothetical protein